MLLNDYHSPHTYARSSCHVTAIYSPTPRLSREDSMMHLHIACASPGPMAMACMCRRADAVTGIIEHAGQGSRLAECSAGNGGGATLGFACEFLLLRPLKRRRSGSPFEELLTLSWLSQSQAHCCSPRKFCSPRCDRTHIVSHQNISTPGSLTQFG